MNTAGILSHKGTTITRAFVNVYAHLHWDTQEQNDWKLNQNIKQKQNAMVVYFIRGTNQSTMSVNQRRSASW